MSHVLRNIAVSLAFLTPVASANAALTEGFVSVDNLKVHYTCEGKGNTTLLIEPGLGVTVSHANETTWDGFLKATTKKFRVCYYDRTGLDKSDKLGPHSSADVANRTQAVAEKIEDGTPVIMVAHSMGGIHAKVINDRHPKLMDGVVLVETTPYGSDAWAKAEFSQSHENEAPEFTQFKKQYLGYRDNPALNPEKTYIMKSSLQSDEAGDFGDKPVATVQRTMQYKDEVAPPPFLPDDLTDRWDQLYRDSEAVYKGLSSNTHFIRSTSISHFLHQADQDLPSVLAALDWVASQL